MMANINWSTTGAMNRPVTCGLPVARALSIGFGTTAFGKGLPKGTKVLTSCCMLRSMSTMLPRCCNAREASAWRWNLAKRRRGGQCLQSFDLAYDLAVNVRRQSTCPTHQVIPNVAELRVSNANSGVQVEQQKRRNDRASEHDQQMPQRPRLAERGHRSDPQNDPDGDAKQANCGRRPGSPDRAVERMDATQVSEQGEHLHNAGKAG